MKEVNRANQTKENEWKNNDTVVVSVLIQIVRGIKKKKKEQKKGKNNNKKKTPYC